VPKLVDHEARRREIVESVWQLIARRGISGVTMRELAAEAGYANGALAPYFRGKEEILLAAFQHVFAATNERARASTGDARGLDALRALCMEIMPLDDVRLLEARVVLAFWDRAAVDAVFAEVYRSRTEEWRGQVLAMLAEARRAGQVVTDIPDERAADALLTLLLGLQVHATFLPERTAPDQQRAILDDVLSGLGLHASAVRDERLPTP